MPSERTTSRRPERATRRRVDRNGVARGIVVPMLVAMTAVAVLAAGCSGGEAVFESDRARPTETALHDHSSENSALAPETVLVEDIAELDDGVAVGDRISAWMGVNVCGRFVEIPAGGPAGGLSVDSGGLVTIVPQEGDPSGHDLTVSAVLDLMDIVVETGEIAFGPSWAPQEVQLEDGSLPLGDAALTTGDSCGEEQGEVQLWYYTPAAVDSGEDVRLVVTDPQDVPVLEEGTAVTVAFAPASSLPTLPPAALVG